MKILLTALVVAEAHILGLAFLQPEIQESALALVILAEQALILLGALHILFTHWKIPHV